MRSTSGFIGLVVGVVAFGIIAVVAVVIGLVAIGYRAHIAGDDETDETDNAAAPTPAPAQSPELWCLDTRSPFLVNAAGERQEGSGVRRLCELDDNGVVVDPNGVIVPPPPTPLLPYLPAMTPTPIPAPTPQCVSTRRRARWRTAAILKPTGVTEWQSKPQSQSTKGGYSVPSPKHRTTTTPRR